MSLRIDQVAINKIIKIIGTFTNHFHPQLLNPILKNQMNFRDLGGIPAMDGRKLKQGLLFRRGDLFNRPPEDITRLEEMNLATIIDFRAHREIAARPDKRVSTVKNCIHIDIFDVARGKAEKFLEENNAAGMETVLIADYRRMVTSHQEDFRRFLTILSDTDDLPLVYHCAAGKDRTGLATVFLLTALGVSMPCIMEDYMATNVFGKSYTDKIIRKVTESGLNGEILRPLLEVRTAYFEAALDEIDRLSGSLQNFVEGVLKADVEALRQKYLEN